MRATIGGQGWGQDEAEGCSGTRAFVAKVSADGRTEWMFNPPEYVAGVTPILENAIRVSSPGCPKRAMESARFGLIGVDGTIEVHVAQATFGFPEMFVARCAVVSLSAGQLVSEDCGPPLAPGYRPPDRYSGETVGGFANGDALIRQFDPSGREVWSRTLTSDGGDGVHAVAPTPDGGVVGAGFALAGPRVGRDNWGIAGPPGFIRARSLAKEAWRRQSRRTQRCRRPRRWFHRGGWIYRFSGLTRLDALAHAFECCRRA